MPGGSWFCLETAAIFFPCVLLQLQRVPTFYYPLRLTSEFFKETSREKVVPSLSLWKEARVSPLTSVLSSSLSLVLQLCCATYPVYGTVSWRALSLTLLVAIHSFRLYPEAPFYTVYEREWRQEKQYSLSEFLWPLTIAVCKLRQYRA